MVLYQEFASGFVGPACQLIIELHQLCRIKVVNREPLVHGCLYCVGDPLQAAPQLILQARQSRVEQRRVEHNLVKQRCPNLIEPCLQSGEVAAEVLHYFEESAHVFLDLEQLRFQLVNLDPVENSQCRGGDGHAQGDSSEDLPPRPHHRHLVQFLRREGL